MQVETEDLWIGISYGVLSTLFLVPYLVVLKIVNDDKELSNSPSHRIIFHLGLAECIQLFTQYSLAIFTASRSVFDSTLNKVISAIMNGFWWPYVTYTTLLTINRFVVLWFGSYASEIFTRLNLNIMFFAIWILGLVDTAIFASPLGMYYYDVDSYSYTRNISIGWTPTVSEMEFWYGNVMQAITGVLYMLIFAHLIAQAKNGGGLRWSREMRVLLQAALISGYLAMASYSWYFFVWLGVENEKWTAVTMQYLFILNGGVNPAIYLTMNRKIRHEFYMKLRWITCHGQQNKDPARRMTVSAVSPSGGTSSHNNNNNSQYNNNYHRSASLH